MGVKSWFKFVTSAIAEVTTYDFSAKRLDWLVGDWGSADRSRSAEPQLAAPVVRLGPSRRAAGGMGGAATQWIKRQDARIYPRPGYALTSRKSFIGHFRPHEFPAVVQNQRF